MTTYKQEHKDKEFNNRLKLIYDHTKKEYFTPFETLGKEIINKLSSINGDILVLSDLGLLIALLRRFNIEGKDTSSITFVAHTDRQEEFAKLLNIKSILIGYNEPIKELKEKTMGMKFDVIVGNPPYIQGLHMKFLQKGFQLLNDDGCLIFIHPATCFIQNKNGNFSGKSIIEEITDHVQSLELLDGSDGKIFDGVRLNALLSITLLTKQKRDGDFIVKHLNGKIVNYSTLRSVTSFHQKDEIKSLTAKLVTYQNLEDLHINDSKMIKSFGVPVAHIHWDVTFFSKETKVQTLDEIRTYCTNKGKGFWNLFEFDSEIECKNFIKYLKTNFARRALSLLKINTHIDRGELALVPYLDFMQEWTDEKLYQQFKLTKEEIDFINIIPTGWTNNHE